MAKKKASDPPAAAAPEGAAYMQPQMMPGMPMQSMPGMQMPMQPQMMQPQMMQPGMPNPMMQMMQMMQMMMGGGMPTATADPSAVPFQAGPPVADGDAGLDSDIIRPALLTDRIKQQKGVQLGSILDCLCLTEDGKNALGGIPQGCTLALAGPPGKGKTRSVLAGLCRVAAGGEKVALVVAEEGFHNSPEAGRDDLCSRLCKIGMAATGIADEKEFASKVLKNIFVMQCQYHKGKTWDDFVAKYRFLVETEGIRFVVVDSLNMLDPTKNRTADNLSSLKTYNHERGITCICVGQIRDTGQPVGGEALQHTADAVFLIEEMSLGSKEIADMWGGKYRDKIDIITAVKSVTTPTFPHPIRIGRDPATGAMIPHASQPAEFAVLPPK